MLYRPLFFASVDITKTKFAEGILLPYPTPVRTTNCQEFFHAMLDNLQTIVGCSTGNLQQKFMVSIELFHALRIL